MEPSPTKPGARRRRSWAAIAHHPAPFVASDGKVGRVGAQPNEARSKATAKLGCHSSVGRALPW